VIKDKWAKEREGGTARLGYQDGTWNKQQLRGLLKPTGTGRWETLTAGMSMRETENEINLLFPGGDSIFAPLYGEPAWSFGPPGEDSDLPDGDELGDSDLTQKGA
jgi:hypothetical protein